jgi:hypothetical protein
MIVMWRGLTSHSTRTWWRACSSTRAAHQRCTRATSISEAASGTLPAASVGLAVRLGSDGPDQFIQLLVGGTEDDLGTRDAHAEHQTFAVGA